MAFAAILAVPDARAQQPCAEGTRTSLTGIIQSIERERPAPNLTIWMIRPRGTPQGACQVQGLLGDVRLPETCGQGRGFSASGKVANAEGTVLLYTDKIVCK